MYQSSLICSDKILEENVCKIKLEGDWGKKFLDETLVGEDDLDFMLNGRTFIMAPWKIK